MTKFLFKILLIAYFTLAGHNLYGQFYYFQSNVDTCYCNDIIILGTTYFDTLTVVVPPKSFKIQTEGNNDYMLEMRRYNYACEKTKLPIITSLRKDAYLYSLFNDDVYIVADWPHVFYDNFIIHCLNDSLKKIVVDNFDKYYHTYSYHSTPYMVKKFRCLDHKQQCFLEILMNVHFFNRVVTAYNCSPAGYLLTEFDENITKGFYVKVLLPLYKD